MKLHSIFIHFVITLLASTKTTAKYVKGMVHKKMVRKSIVNDPPSKNKMVKPTRAKRHLLQARTTITNVDLRTLLDDECIFFEDTWSEAFEQAAKDTTENDEDNDMHVRSVIFEETREVKKGEDDNNHRDLYSLSFKYKIYDVWAAVTFTCNLCGSKYNDDDRRMLEPEYDMSEEFLLRLENTLCQRLGEGPFDVFHTASDCEVTFLPFE